MHVAPQLSPRGKRGIRTTFALRLRFRRQGKAAADWQAKSSWQRGAVKPQLRTAPLLYNHRLSQVSRLVNFTLAQVSNVV